MSNFKNYKELPIERLQPAPWNYKLPPEEEDALMQKLKANILSNGQVENIIVRKLTQRTYEVVNGNHRYQAMKELNIKKVVVFDAGDISLEAAKRLAIETNETQFSNDPIKLAQTIKELTLKFPAEDLAKTTAYDLAQIQNYARLTDFNWENRDKDSKDSADDGEKKETGIKTIFLTLPEELADRFSALLAHLSAIHGDQRDAIKVILQAFAEPLRKS